MLMQLNDLSELRDPVYSRRRTSNAKAHIPHDAQNVAHM